MNLMSTFIGLIRYSLFSLQLLFSSSSRKFWLRDLFLDALKSCLLTGRNQTKSIKLHGIYQPNFQFRTVPSVERHSPLLRTSKSTLTRSTRNSVHIGVVTVTGHSGNFPVGPGTRERVAGLGILIRKTDQLLGRILKLIG